MHKYILLLLELRLYWNILIFKFIVVFIGCIRMRNHDIIELYDAVSENDLVYITYFTFSNNLELAVS